MDVLKAKHIAREHLHRDVVIVDFDGNLYVNCDTETVCSKLEKEKKEFHLLKGERIKKVIKDKEDAKAE